MKKVSILFLVVLLVASGSLTGQPASRLPGPIRVEVTIVLVPTIVLDREGRPVLGPQTRGLRSHGGRGPSGSLPLLASNRKAKPQDGEDEPSPPEPDAQVGPRLRETSRARTFLLVMDNGRQRRFQQDPRSRPLPRRTGLIPADGGTRPDEGPTDLDGWYLLGYIPQNKTQDGGLSKNRSPSQAGWFARGVPPRLLPGGAMKPKSARLLTVAAGQ